MTSLRIDSLTVPDHPGGDGWDDLCSVTALTNEVMAEQLGTRDEESTPEQLLAQWRSPYAQVLVFTARRGEELVGVGQLERDRAQSTAFVEVLVAAPRRGGGIGSVLLDTLVDAAVEQGLTTLQSGTCHTDLTSTPRLASPAGAGDVPAEAPTVRFAQRRGFRLGQVEVLSALPLPVPDERIAALENDLRASDAYELVGWTDATPADLIDAYARLRTVMSTAAPAGEMTEEGQSWDAERVRERDARNAAAGRTQILTAARHRASGELVGFTALHVDGIRDKGVGQGYTLVLPEHRGHSLGMRIKIANLRRLADHPHRAPRIVTGNAGENDAMLSINRALGYAPYATIGWWERALDA